jgi:hypothetical protein
MTTNCNLTEADYKAFRKYVMFRYRKMHWFFTAVLIPPLALSWFGNKPDATTTEKVAGLIGILVIWAGLMVVFFVVWKLITRFTGGGFRGSLGPHAFEIGEDTIIESNAQGRIETRVAGLKRIGETNSHFFVITTIGTGYVIPKRDLQSCDALYALQKRITSGGV